MRSYSPQGVRISEKETLEWPANESGASHSSPQDLERLAHWLDSVFEIPGIGVRFGIDALLGLVPGVGDTASALASVYILQTASRYGIPRITIARMTLNIGLDLLVGAIPFIGDLFDIYWKANRKNVELLRRHFAATPAAERALQRSDKLFVVGMIALIVAALVASTTAAYFLLATAYRAIAQIIG